MADTKTENLTAAGALGGTEYAHIVQGGNSRKVALSDLAQYIKTAAVITPTNLPWKGARVVLSANQSVANNAFASASWASATVDTNGFWSAGAPTRLTVPTGVTKVRVSASIEWALNATGVRAMSLNMTPISTGVTNTTAGSFGATAPGVASLVSAVAATSGIISVSAGDYFELRVGQTSGAALNMIAGNRTWLEIAVVETSGS
jgi:hypothetical protein